MMKEKYHLRNGESYLNGEGIFTHKLFTEYET